MVTSQVVKLKAAVGGGKDEKMTRVDGKGLWRSWKRNFKNKLLALLDLIDNSLDAAVSSQDGGSDHAFIGRVHVYPDSYGDDPSSNITGLCIVNNCIKPIRPLGKVLEVYNSSKVHSGAGDIGENGVGLKQGCATLSDLSFVLVKNGSDASVELGICAESLQREKGCYLPAFKLSNKKGDVPLKTHMKNLFSQPKHEDVARCIAQYGAVSFGDEPSLETGIERLCRHFDLICDNFFGSPYVFMVILDKVHHGQTKEYVRGSHDAQQKITVNRFMKDLASSIDRNYLHIPDDFQFLIGGKRATFKYWPSRLVELSEFTVNVNPKIEWQHKLLLPDHPDTYSLRIFIGFDALRVTDSDAERTCSLYIYSRQSGRLITSKTDVRTDLNVTAGGTVFCQGLTIIVDDIGGKLPLNPTKQEVAFGEEANGQIHRDNLFAWIGAVTHFYYNHHFGKFNGKTQLTQKVAKYGDVLLQKNRQLKTLDSSVLTTYNLTFKAMGKNIRADKSSAQEIVGRDTLYHLNKTEKSPPASSAPKGKKRKAATAASKAAEAPSPKVPRRRQPVSYRETGSSAEEEEETEESNSDDSAKPAARSSAKRKNKKAKTEGAATGQKDVTYEEYVEIVAKLTKKLKKKKAEIEGYEERIRDLEVELENERNLRSVLEEQLGKKMPSAAAQPAKKNGRKNSPPKSSAKPTSNGQTGQVTPCPDIGEGWTQQVMQRSNGKLHKVFISPLGKKFRSRPEVMRYLGGEG